MTYVFKGSLCGLICQECSESLSGMEVLLYLPWRQDRLLATAVAAAKETFHVVGKEEAESRKGLLLATAQTDENGNFEFKLDEKYRESAFDIDFSCGNVPRTPPKPPRDEPIQFHLTTVLPQWRIDREQENYFFRWDHCIAEKWWCFIRGYYFDAWVICGYLRACDTGAAIPNARVTAWDADFLTDDNLGSAVTDASGRYRIDYTSIQFKQTFLSPWINVETDPGLPLTFQSGPDVYFKAEIGGVEILGETSADNRKNVGYCLCVNLCAKTDITPPQPTPIPAFLRVGGYDYDTQVRSHVGENGLTTGNYAFFSSLRLNGILAQRLSGVALEYCFEYTKQYNGTGQPINWTRVLADKIDQTNIGYVEKATLMPADASHPSPWYHYDYTDCIVSPVPVPGSIQVPIAADGWILVPQQNDNPLNPAGVGMFVANGNQINLNSVKLDAFAPVNLSGLVAGNSATSTGQPLVADEVLAVRMLVRQQGNNATITEAGRCTRLAIDNTLYNGMSHHPEWGPWGGSNEYGVCMVDIQQLQVAGCAKIANQVDVLFSCAHPNLGAASLSLTGPTGTIPLPLPAVTPDMFGTVTHTFAAADPLCAYLVTLSATYLLTTGDSNLSTVQDQIAFCR
jgi:hypothetical protein